MQHHLPHNINEEKLAKFFAGEASPDESQEIKAWADQSPENRDLLLQLQVLWIDTGNVELSEKIPTGKYDIDSAWNKVKNKRLQRETESSSFSWFWKVAAGIVLVAAIGWYIKSATQAEELTYYAEASVSTLQLPDGTAVVLNQKSKLIYPEEFAEQRMVKLEGEAFFEVVPNPDQPFIVEAGSTTVKVLGTSFQVSTLEHDVHVIVATGQVLFSAGDEDVLLSAGDMGLYTAETKHVIKKEQSSSTGIDQFWRTKTLRFSSHKLPEVVQTLEEAYDVNIRLDGETLSNCSLSVTFREDSLDNVLDIIALTLNLKVQRNDNEIVLSGTGCTEE